MQHFGKRIRFILQFLILSVLMLFAGCGGAATTDEGQTALAETTAAVTESAADVVSTAEATETASIAATETTAVLDENGTYTSKEEVALYIHTYDTLPDNFITKNDAKALGWDNAEGNLWDVAPGMSIGGDRFGNYEGLLPDADGRKYYECDINYEGGYRGSERIIYSNDGLIYYTGDHYKSFELLYE